MKAVRTLFALLLGAVLLQAAACSGGTSSSELGWLREPLEVTWVEGGAPDTAPVLVYSVAIDSRESHRTALMAVTGGEAVRFLQGAESDANGNAPALPGTEIATAEWFWAPQGIVLGDRSFVFAIGEESDGRRLVRHASWTGPVDTAAPARTAISGSTNAVAFAVAPCGAELCVVIGRERASSGAFELVLARVDAEGEAVGDVVTLASVEGLIRSVHALPDASGEHLDLLVQTCTGCDALNVDDWERAMYTVVSRFLHLQVAVADGSETAAASELLEWGGLMDTARSTLTADGAALTYWRTAATEPPACDPKGHCPIARHFVAATWSAATGQLLESDPVSTSEVAYLGTGVTRDDSIWLLWRALDPADRFLRELWMGKLVPGADPPAEGERVTRTYTGLTFADERTSSPNALPFDYLDALDAAPADDGLWIAMRFRDLLPGGAEICGERTLVGVWSARVSPDGIVLEESDDKDALFRADVCGGDGGCHVGGSTLPSAVFLVLTLALLVSRRRRSR